MGFVAIICLAVVTAEPQYVDESQVPYVECHVDGRTDMSIMGKRFPHIVIDGAKLDYSAKLNWYVHAKGGPKAHWIEFNNKDGSAERFLAITNRSKNGESLLDTNREIEMERWDHKQHKWAPDVPFSPPVIPPRPPEDL